MNHDSKRHDLYGPVHKSLRKEATELLIRLGQADFTDDAQRFGLIQQVREHLDLLCSHLWHEEEFIHPYIDSRESGGSAVMIDDHEAHTAMAATVLRAVERLQNAEAREAEAYGHELYLSFSILVAHDFLHMSREETAVQPKLHRWYTDADLRAIEGRILSSLSPAELARSVGAILPAINHSERIELVERMLAATPETTAVDFIDQIIRPALSSEQWQSLQAAVRLPDRARIGK